MSTPLTAIESDLYRWPRWVHLIIGLGTGALVTASVLAYLASVQL